MNFIGLVLLYLSDPVQGMNNLVDLHLLLTGSVNLF